MKTSEASQLPTFAVKPFHIQEPEGSYDMLEVMCLRCRIEFWVPRRWGLIIEIEGASDKPPAHPTGRPCPNCCKASHIPEEYRIRTEIKHPKPKPRRVVRRRKR